MICICICTSSTAQGGGGSFKNRKPIGEVDCCESGMAERSHWWTERCLRSPLCLSLSLTIYLPTSLSIYLSIYRSIYLSLFLSFIYLPIYLSTYLPIYLSIYLSLSLSLFHLSTVSARIIERSQEYKSTVKYRTFVLLRVPIPRGVGKFNYRTGIRSIIKFPRSIIKLLLAPFYNFWHWHDIYCIFVHIQSVKWRFNEDLMRKWR